MTSKVVVFLHQYAERPPNLRSASGTDQATLARATFSAVGQHRHTRMAFFTSRLAPARMIHTTGGSWDELPFQQNTGEELQHEGEYLSWVPAPRGNRPLVMPPVVLRHTLFYRELT